MRDERMKTKSKASFAQRFQFREVLMTVSQRTLVTCMLIAGLGFAANAIAQGPDAALPRTCAR